MKSQRKRPADRPGAVIEFQSWRKPISHSTATARHLAKSLIVEVALNGRISHVQAHSLIVVFCLESD